MSGTPENIEALQRDIAARLGPVCQGWPEQLFNQLVQSIASISVKYDRAEHSVGAFEYDERITRRLIDDMKGLADRSAEIRDELH